MAKSKIISGTTVLSKWLNAIFGGGAKDVWAATTAYAAGDVIELSGGEILRCIGAGTSDVSEPTAPGELRGTVSDGTITWELFAGHLHDASDMDGSAPKILLTSAAEVTGLLPIENMRPLRGFIDGLIIENATDYNDIKINPGDCASGIGSLLMRLSTEITKQIDAAWSAGDNSGGFPTSITIADDTWYHVFLIVKEDGTIDAGFDTSITAANLLDGSNAGGEGFILYRRIGSVFYLNSTDKIAAFTQIGDDFFYRYGSTYGWELETFLYSSSPGYLQLKKCPPDVSVELSLSIKVLDDGDPYLCFGNGALGGNCIWAVFSSSSLSPNIERGQQLWLRSSTDRKISWLRTIAGTDPETTVHIIVAGYKDFRGKQ
jgi:hypothetical protein